ncbi:MAG: 8-amino-7-oxononanoate synthase [bacterium]|nr:8-amino-7-oxononanoate synthase [bacterium]
MDFLREELDRLEKQGLSRKLRMIDSCDGPTIKIFCQSCQTHQTKILLCSNDYLGLTQHPKVKEKAKEAIERFGCGSGASRLISGTFLLHSELEKKLAEFKKTEAALVFASGYAANLGVISSLAGRGDVIIIDKLNHASIIDGCRLSEADLRVYPHKNMVSLEKILKQTQNKRLRLIITDGVFSMDGDLAPLPEIVNLAKKYKALVMVDDAHGSGVLGKEGRGTVEYFDLEGQIDIQMGTLSKALGSLGGFIAGSNILIEYLINKARSFIYSTALSPAQVATALASLEIIQTEPQLRLRLLQNVRYLKQGLENSGFDTMGSQTQIIPVFIGETNKTMQASKFLYEHGIFAPAIRPPTVPQGKSRLRLSLMATHTTAHLDRVLSAFLSSHQDTS